MIIKEKELKNQFFWEELIENLPIGMMLLDRNGKIIRMNKKQEETSKVKREKVLGKTFQEAFPKTLSQGLKKPYYNLLRNGTPFDIIIDNYIPQYYSKLMTYHARGASFFEKKYFILLHELEEELYHEKRLVEKKTKELEESKNFLEFLIDSSPYIIISTNLLNRIIIFNKTAEKVLGFKREEVIKKKISFLFKEGLNLDKRSALYKDPKEISCIKKDGNPVLVSLLISDIRNTNGKSIGKLYLMNDLTEKKAMEERLLLSEKLALYSELMGGIAHQLNNPLIGVVNFSEMLLKEMNEEDPRRELAMTIYKAGKECLKIITSVLNSIKDPHLTFQLIDVHEILRNSLLFLQDQYSEKLKNIAVYNYFDQNIPPVLGDSIQLKQCFFNILANSVEAIPDKGILKVETLFEEKSKKINIIISDDGIGIPKEHIKKIFLPFFSLKKSSERHGLGLSFAYQIIKNHGGEISVESEEGKGTTFIITLPSHVND